MNQNNSSITLTSSASKRIMSVLSKENSSQFRVYVTGGGCSGFQYGFKFDDEQAFDDDVIDYGKFTSQEEGVQAFSMVLNLTMNRPLMTT